jgi:lipopolysaccharide export system permease protein
MKKIDKLVVKSFIGPLILTFLVIVFILLSKQMLYYFDDIIGKDLGFKVLAQFLLYFAILMLPAALPLSVLLASLITFGNLAEHFELTAVKASGISLVRVIQPILLLVLILTGVAFYTNNSLVPRAALEAYTLLYDIRQKKPALDIREGVFYNGIPDISIKVNKKFPDDDAALKDVILYNHRENDGNSEVLVADSGRMTTILNERYLRFEFFNGYQYTDNNDEALGLEHTEGSAILTRRTFQKSEVVVDLSSFDLKKTDGNVFASHRLMKGMSGLSKDIDSLDKTIAREWMLYKRSTSLLFNYYRHQRDTDAPVFLNTPSIESFPAINESLGVRQNATNFVRQIKSQLENSRQSITNIKSERILVETQWHKIPSNALACLTLFLIGAPLGAIIKKGGIGVPFLASIVFFIIYTLMSMQGEKLAKQGYLSSMTGIWMSNFFMLIIGCFFMLAARNDARLLEIDFYTTAFKKSLGVMLRGRSQYRN